MALVGALPICDGSYGVPELAWLELEGSQVDEVRMVRGLRVWGGSQDKNPFIL